MKVIAQMQDNSVIEVKGQDKVLISKAGAKITAFYCSLLKSQIECYWACLVYILTIARNTDKRYETSSLNKFYNTIQWFMESLYDEKIIEDYEACSLETIKNAYDRYQESRFVKLSEGGKKKESVVEVLVPIEELEGFESKIKFFKQTRYNSFISPTELARQSIKEVTMPKL
jgi:glycerone phosphate O-acyltransferase/fatty acyl-CoA reductase